MSIFINLFFNRCVIKETIKFNSKGDIERQRRIVTLQYDLNKDLIGNSPAESIEKNLRKVKSLGQRVLHSVKKYIILLLCFIY